MRRAKGTSTLRVVGGWLGGRRIEVPGAGEPRHVRPTSERARQAVLNMLFSLDVLEGATTLDLFAGSGALGIEALSNGAAHATFVDSDATACATVRKNLTALEIDDSATVVCADAMRWLAASANEGREFDLAFADPPYAFDSWEELLGRLPAGVLVCESNRKIEPETADWKPERVRRYGTPVITILRRAPSG